MRRRSSGLVETDAPDNRALRELDAWGPVRADMLEQHHAEQREQLHRFLHEYPETGNAEQIARITLRRLRDVRADMHHEETELLTAGLMRDDPISVDMEAG